MRKYKIVYYFGGDDEFIFIIDQYDFPKIKEGIKNGAVIEHHDGEKIIMINTARCKSITIKEVNELTKITRFNKNLRG